MALLDDEVRAKLPTSAAHMENALVIDHEWWAENQARMEPRFAAFVKRSKSVPPARDRTTL